MNGRIQNLFLWILQNWISEFRWAFLIPDSFFDGLSDDLVEIPKLKLLRIYRHNVWIQSIYMYIFLQLCTTVCNT